MWKGIREEGGKRSERRNPISTTHFLSTMYRNYSKHQSWLRPAFISKVHIQIDYKNNELKEKDEIFSARK